MQSIAQLPSDIGCGTMEVIKKSPLEQMFSNLDAMKVVEVLFGKHLLRTASGWVEE